jgi:2-hydroxychromene-2-carboxylate isomerase
MKKVKFYFDFVSPYAWLAERKLRDLPLSALAEVQYVPVLFAGILNAHGTKGPAEIPAKRNYVFRDVLRLATIEGLNPSFPRSHPFNPLAALRFATAVDVPHRPAFVAEVFDLIWNQGQDANDLSVLSGAAEKLNLPAEHLIQKISTDPVKAALRLATDEASKRGLFGVPTFEADGEFFWGTDRLDHVVRFLKGGLRLDERKLESILARPASAQRP